MNKWECQAPGCRAVAFGTGGAIGLRAIGWHFRAGPILYCPVHHPAKLKCRDDPTRDCSLCFATQQAEYHQARMMMGWPDQTER
jgi:hypothetical protein